MWSTGKGTEEQVQLSMGVNHTFEADDTLRGAVKYYFADFVRKGGRGVPPQIRNPLFAEKKSAKVGKGVPPKSVTYFLDQNQVFFCAKNIICRPF